MMEFDFAQLGGMLWYLCLPINCFVRKINFDVFLISYRAYCQMPALKSLSWVCHLRSPSVKIPYFAPMSAVSFLNGYKL